MPLTTLPSGLILWDSQEQVGGNRRSGRTQIMLGHAVRTALDGKNILVLGSDLDQATYLSRAFTEILGHFQQVNWSRPLIRTERTMIRIENGGLARFQSVTTSPSNFRGVPYDGIFIDHHAWERHSIETQIVLRIFTPPTPPPVKTLPPTIWERLMSED